MQTTFRAIVMLATLAIVVKGWQFYGPPTEQLKSFALRATEIVQKSLQSIQQPDSLAADPRTAAAPPAAPPLSVPTSAAQPPLASAAMLLPAGREQQQDSVDDDQQLQAMRTRLEQLGVRDQRLEPWGSSGEFYRFSCRVPWGEVAGFSRHFESVAQKPLAAVAAVAEKVGNAVPGVP
ncbi:MAG: hypothetical protein L0Z07_10185 [Planctomycetes bacterium]|nr:hypothetical protein [Planctomycetota bacterium]